MFDEDRHTTLNPHYTLSSLMCVPLPPPQPRGAAAEALSDSDDDEDDVELRIRISPMPGSGPSPTTSPTEQLVLDSPTGVRTPPPSHPITTELQSEVP